MQRPHPGRPPEISSELRNWRVDIHRDGVGGGPAGSLLLLDGLGIGVEQRRQPRRMLVRDLLEAGAELGVVLLRVAERLLRRALALLAKLIGHPQVETVERSAVAAEGVVPLSLANDPGSCWNQLPRSWVVDQSRKEVVTRTSSV